MTRHFADDINAAAARAARLGLQTRIDLDAFLALDSVTRAARWRGWDVTAKRDAVVQMITRIWVERFGPEDAGAAWDEALVELWIARYDARWGGELTQTERAVVGALELLADQAAGRAGSPTATPAERAEAQAQGRQVAAAQHEFLSGRRAVEAPHGTWSVPSATRPGQVYQVRLGGERPVCSCRRRASGCWHASLVSASESAPDLIHDPVPSTPALLPFPTGTTSTPRPADDEPTLGGVPLRFYEDDAPAAWGRAWRWAA